MKFTRAVSDIIPSQLAIVLIYFRININRVSLFHKWTHFDSLAADDFLKKL